jgi:hypothetical protein
VKLPGNPDTDRNGKVERTLCPRCSQLSACIEMILDLRLCIYAYIAAEAVLEA